MNCVSLKGIEVLTPSIYEYDLTWEVYRCNQVKMNSLKSGQRFSTGVLQEFLKHAVLEGRGENADNCN